MNEQTLPEQGEKLVWDAPVLLDLNAGLDAVATGALGGNDGSGGLNTSLS